MLPSVQGPTGKDCCPCDEVLPMAIMEVPVWQDSPWPLLMAKDESHGSAGLSRGHRDQRGHCHLCEAVASLGDSCPWQPRFFGPFRGSQEASQCHSPSEPPPHSRITSQPCPQFPLLPSTPSLSLPCPLPSPLSIIPLPTLPTQCLLPHS